MQRNRLPVLPLLAITLAWLSVPVLAADTIPSRITDPTFWKLVNDISEPGGTFESENWISNETGIQTVIPRLKQLTKPDGVYLGVGPEQNFTYIAAIRPKIAFIIDIRRQNMLQHMVYKAAFEMSENRADFLSRLFSRARPAGLSDESTVAELFNAYRAATSDGAGFQRTLGAIKELLVEKHKFALTGEDFSGIEHILKVFSELGPAVNYNSGRGGPATDLPSYADLMTATDGQGQERSYLASEENYQVVRDMQMRNLIIPVIGDFAGTKAVRAVGQYLKDHNATVTAFYVSNVETYLFRSTANRNGGSKNFYDNVATLPLDSSSMFIRSWSGGGPLPSGGMPFTLLSPIHETLTAVRNGQVQTARDVFSLSK